MKQIKQLLSSLLLVLSLLSPLTVCAVGDSNMDTGGTHLGSGSSTNFWSNRDEGVRITVVEASDGTAVSTPVDLTNRNPDDIMVHFGKVSKSQYRDGTALTPSTGTYRYVNPAQSLPNIITSTPGSVSLDAIKSYFTDEQVIRSIAGLCNMDYEILISGAYKLLIEPIAYVTHEGTRTAFTATEAALYNKAAGGMLRRSLTDLTHRNLPLALFLEVSDAGYEAWEGATNEKVNDDEIISCLGLGIVRFGEVSPPPERVDADYEYRINTDVITSVIISGGEADPDHPARVTFDILGRSYMVTNIYYPEGGQQLVWVRWHTPSEEQHITIGVSSNMGELSTTHITANIVSLDEDPPPNPVADDRNDTYDADNAVVPDNRTRAEASWSVWRPWWREHWVWHSDWQWQDEPHSVSCLPGCTIRHGSYEDEGDYEDEGWWEYSLDYYSASMEGQMELYPDAFNPTAGEDILKSGYGVGIYVSAESGGSGMVTGSQTAVSFFPEFYYASYWRMLEAHGSGRHTWFEFQKNEYSTYRNRTHFTPVWFPDGRYTVYTYVLDCWTPAGMLSLQLTDSVAISGNLWQDWHIAPRKAGT